LNVGHYPAGIGTDYPYTTTLYVNAKKGDAAIPGGEDIFACNTDYGLPSGALYYLDGDKEHEDEETGAPLAYRSITLGSNSGGNSFHFHAGDKTATATITCSVTDPRSSRVVSTSVNIAVGNTTGEGTGKAASIKAIAAYPVLGTQGNLANVRQSTAIDAYVWDDANQAVPDASNANLQVSIRPTTGAATGARLLAGSQQGGVVQVKTKNGVGQFSLASGASEGSILLEMVADRADNNVTNGIQDAIISLVVINVANGTPDTTTPDPLVIAAAAPTAATNGLPYSFAFSVTGGKAPYTWSALGGLPEGLSLSSSGILSGTPNVKVPGAVPVAIRVTDSAGASATGNFSITVAAAPAGADPTTNVLSINLSGCGNSDANTTCALALANPESPTPTPTPDYYYQYVLSVTGPGTGNAAWAMTQNPSWLALDTARGILSITWTAVTTPPVLKDCKSGAFFITATRGGVSTMRKVQLVIGSGADNCKP
jgi:hypothetical protein